VKFQISFFIIILVMSNQALGMKRFSSFFRAGGQTISSIPYSLKASVAQKEHTISTNFNFFHPTRMFSSSSTNYGFWDFFNNFKSDSYKNFGKKWEEKLNSPEYIHQKNLIKSMNEKIQVGKSSFFADLSLEEIVEKMNKDNLINTESAGTSLKPLGHAILASQNQSEEKQEYITKLLLKFGAHIDQKSLLLSVRKKNLGALKILQPNFEPKEIYRFYDEVKDNIDNIMEHTSASLAMYKKILSILKQPCKETTYTKGSSIFVDEFNIELCQETIMTSSCEELYNVLNKNKKKKSYYYYNSERSNSNYYNNSYNERFNSVFEQKEENSLDLCDPIKYQNSLEKDLCTFYNDLRKKQGIENLLGISHSASKKDINTACLKSIQKYHPDFFHYDKELQKLATSITQKLNQMRR